MISPTSYTVTMIALAMRMEGGGVAEVPPTLNEKYTIAYEHRDQARVENGQFIWGEYGIGVDFAM